MSYYKPSRTRRHAPPAPANGFDENLPESVADLFAGEEPTTSASRDNREAPPCKCGAPVCRDGLCARCFDNYLEPTKPA